MKIFRNKTILSILMILILSGLALPSYGDKVTRTFVDLEDVNRLIEIIEHIGDNYPFEVDKEQLITNGIRGMLRGLDEYSDYYTKEETEELLKDLTGDYVGIGVYIRERDDYIEIVSPMEGSPGEEAGLKAGDLIVTIDGIDIKNIRADQATFMIQGIEDTTVKLGILRGGQPDLIYYEVARKRIEVNPVSYDVLDNKIGYIRLTEFNNYADINVKKALKEFDKQGISKVVFDLRDNLGGLLDQAIAIARLFVPKGPIIHVRDNSGLRTYASTNSKPKYELVMLINEYSASASEIVAGAVKGRKAGLLVGKKTFGKGVIQAMQFLPEGGLIKLTTAEYLLPDKAPIHKIGIEPDIEVDNHWDRDLQLEKAIEVLSLSPEQTSIRP